MADLNNSRYLKNIANIGDQHQIIADDDIYSVTGIKLLKHGSKINTKIFSDLLSHKLTKPIDESLTIENCITTDVILSKINELTEKNILAKEILKDIKIQNLVSQVIKSIKIPKPLQFKLNLLEISMPKTVNHCLLVTLASIYIAYKQNIEQSRIVKLAYAAIFLDIGLLHIDSSIFNKTTPLSDEERKNIYSHPIVAALIINTYLHDKNVCLSIMDHHERADGSGYPKGKKIENICENGLILGIAELAVSLSEASGKYSFKIKIQSILKFNAEQYDKKAILILHELIATMDDTDHIYTNSKDNSYYMDIILKLWSIINNNDNDIRNQKDISEFISNQLFTLKYNLNMSGLSMDIFTMDNKDIDEILTDAEETHALIDEAMYKLKSTINEIKRRWLDKINSHESYKRISNWLEHVDSITNN